MNGLVTVRARQAGGPLFRIDAGWLFLLSGIAVLSSTVLIPAMNDLAEAQWRREQARAIEAHRERRLENHERCLTMLRTRDETLMRSLMATQLNLMPEDKEMVLAELGPWQREATIYPSLEPVFIPAAAPVRPDSRLQRLASDRKARLWLIAAGAMCVMIGLMPESRRSRLRSEDVGGGEAASCG